MPDRERDRNVGTVPETPTDSPAATRSRYGLAELAELLDAPSEKVRLWLSDGGVHPLSDDAPDDYGLDAMEYVRTRGHQF